MSSFDVDEPLGISRSPYLAKSVVSTISIPFHFILNLLPDATIVSTSDIHVPGLTFILAILNGPGQRAIALFAPFAPFQTSQ